MAIRFDARTNSLSTDASAIDFEQRVTTTASTATVAGLNIAEGVAPSAPIDGDVWVTAGGAFNVRLNGATVDLSASNVSKVGTPADNQIAVWTGDGTLEGEANLTYNASTFSTNSSNIDMGAGRLDVKTVYVTGSGGGIVRIYGTGGVAYFSMLHNDTDINLAGLGGTVDMNITGLTAINAGTVDADFDNLTATDFNGVALTTGGVATNYLDETGNYSVPTASASFDALSGKTAGTGDYTTTGDFTADNFVATGLGPLTTPGTDDAYIGGYGIMGDRAAAPVYVTNANATGIVQINAGGVHGAAAKVAEFATTGMQMDDDMKIFLGTGNDLTLYHNGTDNYIDSVLASSDLYLRTNSNENAIRCRVGNAVELYYNAGKTFATDGPGEVGVYGDVDIDADTRRVNFKQANGTLKGYIGYSASSAIYIRNQTDGSGIIMDATDAVGGVSNILIADPDTDTSLYGEQDVRLYTNAGTHISVQCLDNGATSLHYQGTSKIQTQDQTAAGNSSGADVVDGAGTFRPIGFNNTPQTTNNATNVPFTQAQVGYDIIHDNTTAYTWTTQASSGTGQTDIPAGSMWKCTNLGSGVISIAAGTSVTLYWLDGSGTTGTRSLAQWGTCTVYKYSNTQYHIWGTGLT